MPLFLTGCFPVDFQEGKRPLRTKSVKRPIKVGKRPINEGKRPIKAKVLVGVAIGCLMGCFRAPPPWGKMAPLKRPIKRSMKFVWRMVSRLVSPDVLNIAIFDLSRRCREPMVIFEANPLRATIFPLSRPCPSFPCFFFNIFPCFSPLQGTPCFLARFPLLFLNCLLSRKVLCIFFSYLPGNFALKNGGDFW